MKSGFMQKTTKALLAFFFILTGLSSTRAQSSHVAFITNLNTKEEFQLKEGDSYYFEIKNESDIVFGKLHSIKADSLNVDGRRLGINQLAGISKKKFKRLPGLHKFFRAAGLAGGVAFLTGILMSGSASDWDPIENSFFGKSSLVSVPLIIPSVLFLTLHKGPDYDLTGKHLLETKALAAE